MDHADARELLELAAIEPDGLDRLMAGDTPEASSLAAHLAGCPECTAEMARVRRATGIVRSVIRSTPPPELRTRTLAFVAAVGRERSGSDVAPGGAAQATRSALRAVPAGDRRPGWRSALWPAALAAAVVISVAATGAWFSTSLESRLARQDAAIAARDEIVAGLSRVSSWSLRLSAEPDAERVSLASASGDRAAGTLVYSAERKELVVVATGLVEPSGGREFRCWVEVDGQRVKIGRMFFGGDLAYWAGEVPAIDEGSGASFGVSVVDAADPDAVDGAPVISGEL
jgi:hypothetical protein